MDAQSKKVLIVVLSIVAIIGSAIFIFWPKDHEPPEKKAMADSLATTAAEEVSKILGGQGGQVVILIHSESEHMMPWHDMVKETFLSLLKKQGAKVSATEELVLDYELYREESISVTEEQFVEMMNKHNYADLVVSMVGLPPFSRSDLKGLPDDWPKLMVFTDFGLPEIEDLKGLFEVAIFPRLDPVSMDEVPEGAEPPLWLEYYKLVQK